MIAGLYDNEELQIDDGFFITVESGMYWTPKEPFVLLSREIKQEICPHVRDVNDSRFVSIAYYYSTIVHAKILNKKCRFALIH